MSSRYDNALPNFKLTTIQQSQREFGFFNDLPLILISVRNLTKEAWIAIWHGEVQVISSMDFAVNRTSALGR